MLLTPPSLLTRSALPPLQMSGGATRDLDTFDRGVEFSQDLPSPVDKIYLQKIPPYVPTSSKLAPQGSQTDHSGLKFEDVAGLRNSPYLHRSPFVHIPERRSAPKRTLDLSQTDTVWPPTCVQKALQEPIPPIAANNSLGLECDNQHIEYSLVPFTPPYDDDLENRVPLSATNSKALKAKGRPWGNPVSPPICRSPLVSLQIASALSALDLPDEGLRSVEAAKYEMGKQEAEYIARRLAEEQRRRQAKERAASGGEERGRSRAKKRAVSYSSGSLLG